MDPAVGEGVENKEKIAPGEGDFADCLICGRSNRPIAVDDEVCTLRCAVADQRQPRCGRIDNLSHARVSVRTQDIADAHRGLAIGTHRCSTIRGGLCGSPEEGSIDQGQVEVDGGFRGLRGIGSVSGEGDEQCWEHAGSRG